jgi:hypothetical protein
LLVWIYYSAQILFFGAEFTQVYANNYGSKIVPEGEEEDAQAAATPEARRKPAKEPTPQLVPVAASAISARQNRLESENSQTARIFVGLMAASFFTGILTTIFGLKRR